MELLSWRRSLVAVGLAATTGAAPALALEWCPFRGSLFSDGGTVCQDHVLYRCDGGDWKSLEKACRDDTLGTADSCEFSGIHYSTGFASCQAGTQQRCDDGVWKNTGLSCSVGDEPIRAVPSVRTCDYQRLTVLSNSTVCKLGSTFMCRDGSLVSLGTLCR